ncbi:hypothetical protein FD724_07565 [Nostoc sp. C057]|uniref:hypothetical protein n=1 Tax=Nostoc sp. C057 TaxID=2576903 RepID=UPI0015C403CA|nr:hypothetical protein [Nostoc sp. C057]QLE47884.1 hypothetical protein FD724_06995 [Nostoc sp. C057]QLE47993.1 hypothetical protein FD724_07565 [Nostoc sp. C057]
MAATWLTKLQRWIKQLFKGKKKRRSSPKIIKRWYGKDCAVLRIERTTPGGLSTYRVTSIHGECDYLITLDYLPELLAEMAGEFNGTSFRLRSHDNQYNPALTHRFAIWRVWRNGDSSPVGIWDCDLQGFTQGFALRELAPRRAVAGVALAPLSLIHIQKNPKLSWQNQMEHIDWLLLLEQRIRGELSNPHHNLKAIDVLQDSE